MLKTPTFRDPEWMEYFEEHYLRPMREMYADPVKYAAYRARVEEAAKSPAEVQRRKDVDAMFARVREQRRRADMIEMMD